MQKYHPTYSAASFLGYSPSTLRNSRNTGTLAGVPAPAYKKLGRSVRYEQAVLEEWLDQFSEIRKTGKEA